MKLFVTVPIAHEDVGSCAFSEPVECSQRYGHTIMGRVVSTLGRLDRGPTELGRLTSSMVWHPFKERRLLE